VIRIGWVRVLLGLTSGPRTRDRSKTLTCDNSGALGGTRTPNLLIRSKIMDVHHRPRRSVLPARGHDCGDRFQQNPQPSVPPVSTGVSKIALANPYLQRLFTRGPDLLNCS
jgi:hypothetical protein